MEILNKNIFSYRKYNLKIKPENLLLFFCFFPFIGINIGTDTQPFALVLSIYILLKKHCFSIRYKNSYFVVITILLLLSIISIAYVDPFLILKRLFSYASIIIIPFAVYNSNLFDNPSEIETKIKKYILVWFTVGFVQYFINRSFLTFIVPLYRSSVTRGVCSLASEPSFYGYMCFLMIFFVLDFNRNKIFYIVILLFQIIVFAQSGVTLVYLIIFVMLYMLEICFNTKVKFKNVVKICIIILLVLIVYYYIETKMSGSRIANLMTSIINNPAQLIENDESVASRLEAITISFSNYGVPYLIGSRTLMSGFGGVIYELGVFGVFLIAPIIKTIYTSNILKNKVSITITILLCMFSAIQLSSPLFSCYIGYCYSKIERLKKYESI